MVIACDSLAHELLDIALANKSHVTERYYFTSTSCVMCLGGVGVKG